eukprot:Polyplicarium_translucidae@DN1923_c0_g1_i1.p1
MTNLQSTVTDSSRIMAGFCDRNGGCGIARLAKSEDETWSATESYRAHGMEASSADRTSTRKWSCVAWATELPKRQTYLLLSNDRGIVGAIFVPPEDGTKSQVDPTLDIRIARTLQSVHQSRPIFGMKVFQTDRTTYVMTIGMQRNVRLMEIAQDNSWSISWSMPSLGSGISIIEELPHLGKTLIGFVDGGIIIVDAVALSNCSSKELSSALAHTLYIDMAAKASSETPGPRDKVSGRFIASCSRVHPEMNVVALGSKDGDFGILWIDNDEFLKSSFEMLTTLKDCHFEKVSKISWIGIPSLEPNEQLWHIVSYSFATSRNSEMLLLTEVSLNEKSLSEKKRRDDGADRDGPKGKRLDAKQERKSQHHRPTIPQFIVRDTDGEDVTLKLEGIPEAINRRRVGERPVLCIAARSIVRTGDVVLDEADCPTEVAEASGKALSGDTNSKGCVSILAFEAFLCPTEESNQRVAKSRIRKKGKTRKQNSTKPTGYIPVFLLRSCVTTTSSSDASVLKVHPIQGEEADMNNSGDFRQRVTSWKEDDDEAEETNNEFSSQFARDPPPQAAIFLGTSTGEVFAFTSDSLVSKRCADCATAFCQLPPRQRCPISRAMPSPQRGASNLFKWSAAPQPKGVARPVSSIATRESAVVDAAEGCGAPVRITAAVATEAGFSAEISCVFSRVRAATEELAMPIGTKPAPQSKARRQLILPTTATVLRSVDGYGSLGHAGVPDTFHTVNTQCVFASSPGAEGMTADLLIGGSFHCLFGAPAASLPSVSQPKYTAQSLLSCIVDEKLSVLDPFRPRQLLLTFVQLFRQLGYFERFSLEEAVNIAEEPTDALKLSAHADDRAEIYRRLCRALIREVMCSEDSGSRTVRSSEDTFLFTKQPRDLKQEFVERAIKERAPSQLHRIRRIAKALGRYGLTNDEFEDSRDHSTVDAAEPSVCQSVCECLESGMPRLAVRRLLDAAAARDEGGADGAKSRETHFIDALTIAHCTLVTRSDADSCEALWDTHGTTRIIFAEWASVQLEGVLASNKSLAALWDRSISDATKNHREVAAADSPQTDAAAVLRMSLSWFCAGNLSNCVLALTHLVLRQQGAALQQSDARIVNLIWAVLIFRRDTPLSVEDAQGAAMELWDWWQRDVPVQL